MPDLQQSTVCREKSVRVHARASGLSAAPRPRLSRHALAHAQCHGSTRRRCSTSAPRRGPCGPNAEGSSRTHPADPKPRAGQGPDRRQEGEGPDLGRCQDPARGSHQEGSRLPQSRWPGLGRPTPASVPPAAPAGHKATAKLKTPDSSGTLGLCGVGRESLVGQLAGALRQ